MDPIAAIWSFLRTLCPWAFVLGFSLYQIPPSSELLDKPGVDLFFGMRFLALLTGLGLWYFVQRLLRKKRRVSWTIGIWTAAAAGALLLYYIYYVLSYRAEQFFSSFLIVFTLDSLLIGFIVTGVIPFLQALLKKA
jgi:hypothetical protein